MFDIGLLTNKINGAMKAFMDRKKTDSDYSIVIETDLNNDLRHQAGIEGPSMEEEECNELCVMDELQHYMKVKDEIEAAICDTCQRDLKCQILLPQTLTSRVSEDIVRMSLSEPCGVHGCAIYITIQDKGKSVPLTTIYGNVSAPPTFEIHLTLREDDCGWRKLQKAFFVVKGCLLNSKWKVAPKILRPSYQLEKRKLYRSGASVESVQKAVRV